MRQFIPSLPLFLTLLPSASRTVLLSAEPLSEDIARPRALYDRRSDLQWPAIRAKNAEPALKEIAARSLEDDLVARQNYYAFSGAIYIVGPNGQSLSNLNAASPAYCPNSAPQSCGNIGVWNWCCPSGNTCAWADSAHTYVGCCPSGVTCAQGSVNANQIQTVTVYVTTTQYQQPNEVTTVIAAGGQGSTTTAAGNIIVVGKTTGLATYNGYCTTIYAQNLGPTPTTAAAACGIALVVNEAARPVLRQVLTATAAFWLLVVFVGVVPFRIRS
ncbi:uncharacterized protein PV09_05433 [Verruconis gallopava]|uniref:Uncharacterized protein n=1 Tax=Verruconis gallopava TaxID=253628 RepID=A0A0D2A8X0_9PEZI|nr:uncharacterized protein PV09_05433 [Verruconis gallopava]KIW03208.1 hypothetical protein PV09_05433 [Verruconis gallopava]